MAQVPNAQAQVQQRKGPKLIVFKYKAKKHYRKKNGHRQRYTRLLIGEIVTEGQAPAEADEEAGPLPVVEAVAEDVAEAEAAVEDVAGGGGGRRSWGGGGGGAGIGGR